MATSLELRKLQIRTAVEKAIAVTATSPNDDVDYVMRFWSLGHRFAFETLRMFQEVCDAPPPGWIILDRYVSKEVAMFTFRRPNKLRAVFVFEACMIGHAPHGHFRPPDVVMTAAETVTPWNAAELRASSGANNKLP